MCFYVPDPPLCTRRIDQRYTGEDLGQMCVAHLAPKGELTSSSSNGCDRYGESVYYDWAIR
jgi:hypothetical protein